MDITQKPLTSLGAVIEVIGAADFWVSLNAFLIDLVPHEMSGAWVYVRNDPPIRIYDSEGNPQRERVHEILAKVGYLISPYYNGLIKPGAKSDFYHIDDIAPDEFRRSGYYKAYYGRKGVSDEGMFLSRMDDDTTIVMMVERRARSRPFESQQVDLLRSMAVVVNSLIRRHLRLFGLGDLATPEQRQARSAFSCIAERFGSEILTNRERDVAMLILRGHSSKSAARELDISPETERVHRRRLYTRLELTSHSELFWLFIEASDFFDPVRNNDPLLNYLQEKKPELLSREKED